jgi:hypothetical protein
VYLAQPRVEIDQAVIISDIYFYSIDETLPGVVVTPTCDFANQKCELAHVCAVLDAWQVVAALLRGAWSNMGLTQQSGALIAPPLSAGKRKELANQIRQLATQRYPRYHWLSPLPNRTIPQIVDFQLMASVPIAELQRATVIAELASPYREEVAARYSAYMGRVGTPDYSQQQLDAWINQGIDSLFPLPRAD